MPKRPKHYFRPKTLEEALRLLQQGDAAPLGGGTRLLADDVPVETVVDLQDLGLDQIALAGGELRVGAMVRLQDLADAEPLDGSAGELLRQAITYAGPNTLRYAATVGGVVGSRDAHSELLAVLLAMEARLELAGANQRFMTLAEYLAVKVPIKGLIVNVLIPWSKGKGSIHRVARTPQDMPIISVVAWQPERESENIRSAAVGIGSVPTQLLKVDSTLNEHSIEVAMSLAQDSVTHPGDFLGSRAYRREMVGVLLRRALEVFF